MSPISATVCNARIAALIRRVGRGIQWQAQQFRVNLSIGVWICDRPVPNSI
ncbi:hypothetical protein [Nostoc sp.]|uniref:hypothetical protein n=1 Tax=Nostoc sp. TaxID=1180 RepID=UPI002FFA70B2